MSIFEIPTIWWIVILGYELLALRLIIQIWRSEELLGFKIGYSLVAIIPFIGMPAVYWIANIPSPQAMRFRDERIYEADVTQRNLYELDRKNVRTPSMFYKKVIKGKKR